MDPAFNMHASNQAQVGLGSQKAGAWGRDVLTGSGAQEPYG